MPPLSLETSIFYQFNQCILPPLEPHQKCAIMFSISLQHSSGILKQLITYLGIALDTTIIITSFLALGRNFSFHPFNFFRSRSLTKEKITIFDLSKTTMRPRYLLWESIIFALIRLLVIFLSTASTFRLKMASDLFMLTTCPNIFYRCLERPIWLWLPVD